MRKPGFSDLQNTPLPIGNSLLPSPTLHCCDLLSSFLGPFLRLATPPLTAHPPAVISKGPTTPHVSLWWLQQRGQWRQSRCGGGGVGGEGAHLVQPTASPPGALLLVGIACTCFRLKQESSTSCSHEISLCNNTSKRVLLHILLPCWFASKTDMKNNTPQSSNSSHNYSNLERK
ncbi:hypothetical protein Nepgr_022395 [Nepenthes gracilis]|uniref:Uncharacterized protein n=1 Tax=Nepenthes gracilis TaxID=150966 RepID=A0AAD3T0U1_NEPGR|nr:hypothetical protein Nepgr_022395 [Nepenthes gracilis]